MAENIALTPVGSLIDTTTAQTTINNNFTTIQTALTDVVSLTGVSPNAMQSDLDMNSNQIINLPEPITANSPLRLQDLSTFNGNGTVTNIPTGGTTGQILTKNSNANFDVEWTSQSNGLVAGTNMAITGSSPATVSTINNPVFSTSVTTPLLKNTGTLTLPTSTDTLVGRATTDTLTNKTLTSPIINGGVYGGTATNSGLVLAATTNGSPSGDVVTIHGTSVNIGSAVSGGSTVNIGQGVGGGVILNVGNSGNGTQQLNLYSSSGNLNSILPSSSSANLTLPTGTATLVGDSVSQILTNKTINGNSNSLTVLGNSQISGNIPVTNLNSGSSASSTTFWRGDGIWSAPPTGSVVFLETLTPSSVASIATTVSWSGYNIIELHYYNIISSVSSDNLLAQVQIGGATQAAGYTSIQMWGTGAANSTSSFSTAYLLGTTTTTIPSSGTVKIFGINSTINKSFSNTGYSGGLGGSGSVLSSAGQYSGSTSVLSGLLVSVSSGTFSGIIKVYGIV